MISDSSADPNEWMAIGDALDVVVARGRVREIGAGEGLTAAAVEALALATTEVAQNILIHASAGELAVRPAREPGRRGVVVVARDRGPGIGELRLALTDGYSTGSGLGLGLPSARRLVDDFVIDSRPNQGTVVILTKWAS
jgi:serine/threonine-protein kinase RsbT